MKNVDGDWGCGDGCGSGDTKKWGPNSIYDILCKICNTPVEFFKDEKKHTCPKCGDMVYNDTVNKDCC